MLHLHVLLHCGSSFLCEGTLVNVLCAIYLCITYIFLSVSVNFDDEILVQCSIHETTASGNVK